MRAQASMNYWVPPAPELGYCKVCSHPLKESGCPECWQRSQEQRAGTAHSVEMIGGLRAWRDHTEEAFVRTAYNANALSAALRFDSSKESILFHGPRGTGKTHLAGIIKRRLILHGQRVLTVSMPDVIDEMISDMKLSRINNWVAQMVNVPVLSIEDVGAGEKNSEFIVKLYFRVIDGRYKAERHGLIMTTNHSLPELEQLWSKFDSPGRIVSRLQEMCKKNIFSFSGERDWRAE